MALLPCPECGHQISDRAIACPQCGCPRTDAPAPSDPSLASLTQTDSPGPPFASPDDMDVAPQSAGQPKPPEAMRPAQPANLSPGCGLALGSFVVVLGLFLLCVFFMAHDAADSSFLNLLLAIVLLGPSFCFISFGVPIINRSFRQIRSGQSGASPQSTYVPLPVPIARPSSEKAFPSNQAGSSATSNSKPKQELGCFPSLLLMILGAVIVCGGEVAESRIAIGQTVFGVPEMVVRIAPVIGGLLPYWVYLALRRRNKRL